MAVCEQLLTAGAKVAVLSTATKRSALHFACLKGHSAVAKLLVAKGGADPYMAGSQGGESVMALLRKRGGKEDLQLLSDLDELCSKQEDTSTTTVGGGAAGFGGFEGCTTN